MQLTGLAIQARTIIVVDTIGDIGRLLDLGQQDATTDGMDTTRRQIKDIARLDGMVSQHLGNGTIGNTPAVLLSIDLLFEACIEMGIRGGLDDIPHLGLTHLAMLALRHLVVGMYLNAQVALGINELHQ